MPATVDQENCTGCGDCVEACPTDTVELVNEKAIVKPDDCIECNACVEACIHHAMSMAD
jgi:NAD-dependent dihydropyrimidine dehydrogenase PreA subunit